MARPLTEPRRDHSNERLDNHVLARVTTDIGQPGKEAPRRCSLAITYQVGLNATTTASSQGSSRAPKVADR
jgi:hypothetical protein